MGDCAYCGKRRINFNQDEDYTMRIENNDRGDYFIATGELMIDSAPISFCPFCGRNLKEGEVNDEIIRKAQLAADFMTNLSKAIETREGLIMSLDLESEDYIPDYLSKTGLLEAIRAERSMLLELYKMVEADE